ncbi:glycoside hydrolase family 65 [Ignavibacteria bacterium 4148-Me]|uniref:glycoside hydrolase family 65 n=1 Tax=Rosettibacter primus TaxID=3111523 RepID=UPI00336C07E8
MIKHTIILLFLLVTLTETKSQSDKIDRYALVHRHIPVITKADSLSPFSVGNGKFTFTVDFTGLQTFSDYYENGIPLCTQSEWGWHSFPNEFNYKLEDTFEYYETYGRKVPYASKQNSSAGEWLRANPHRINLGRIGLRILNLDSTEIKLSDVKNIHQEENIWEGIIKSSFDVNDKNVFIETACHPQIDQIAVRIKSNLLNEKRIAVKFMFPYGSGAWGKNASDWESPNKHFSEIILMNKNYVLLKRTIDTTKYYVAIQWNKNAVFEQKSKHHFLLSIKDENEFEFSVKFSSDSIKGKLLNPDEVFELSRNHWKNFWMTGGTIDFSKCSDPRAFELERRIVLSRYLTAIQCGGDYPPQETGLTFNSWYGKFHLEMSWWHLVHFVLWGHPEFLEKKLNWYEKILPSAKQNAELQGYKGARWPKMVSIDGRENPSKVGVFLIWQQPHPIYFAELLYQYHQDDSILYKYKNIVFETAEFLSSYAIWDEKNKRYVLGPPLIPAQEIYKPEVTINPTFELSYWSFGLKTAQKWRERLGLGKNENWEHIIENLSKLPVKNSLYQNAENAMNTFEDEYHRNDHPTLLAAFGMIPNDNIDKDIMRNTLKKVLEYWNWEKTWGWDYPMIAMTAARIGEPELAVDALLMNVKKNTYLINGHNYQDERLPIYLPGNGGLLTAVAMMAAGWDGAPKIAAPGFPKNGKWKIKVDGIKSLP